MGRPSDIAGAVERLEARALLTDLTPPVVLSATPIDNEGGATFSQVEVVFDEAVATPSATNVQNYRITGPTGAFVVVTSAAMDSADVTGKTVLLTVAPQSISGSYGVHVGGVSDLAGNAGTAIGRNYGSTSTLTFNPISMATGDYDGDGLLDITIASNNGYDIWFYKGLGNGDFGTASLAYSSTTTATRLEPKSADIDGDGKLDLVVYEAWSDPSTGSGIGIYFGNGDGTFQAPSRQAFAHHGVDMEVTDIDKDGDLDILAASAYSFRTYLNPHNPLDPAPESQTTVRGFDTWTCVVSAYDGFTQVSDLQIGDVNGDGRSDVVASYSIYPLQIWLGTATPGVFAAPVASIAVATGEDNALADLNGDGRLDFISSYGGTIAYGIAGSPYFSAPQETAFGSDAYRAFLSPVDLDGDGDLDLVAGRKPARFVYDRNVYVLYNQGDGNFDSTVTTFDLASLGLDRVHAAQFADLNGDGMTDVIGLDTSSQRFFVMKSQIGASSTNFVFARNSAPTPSAGGTYSIAEGDSLSVSAAGSTDPDGDALTYSWDINNDGVFGDATGVAPTLTWSQLVALGIADNGSRTVAVRATDSRGGSATSTATLTISNTAPTLVLSGSGTVDEGASYTLNLSSSDPGTDTITSWLINWGDGAITSETSHTYADDGIYLITVTATDEDGTHPGGISWSVVVANVAPTVAITGTGTSLEGSAFTQTGTINDLGTGDTWTATVDYGDGTGVQTLAVNGNSFSLNHVFANTGTFTVVVRVTDDDGGEGTATLLVTVTNVTASSIALSGPSAGNANQPVEFNAIPSVTGNPSENYTYQWTLLRNGIVVATSIETSFSFSAAFGTYTINLRLTDDEGNITDAIAATYTVAKATTDINADMIGYASGVWTVASSTGTAFSTANWASWGDVVGATVTTGDFNGDGLLDVVRLENGKLFVGISNGSSSFSRSQWADLGPGAWSYLMSGDVNGDGRADLVTRLGTGWYVSLSTGTSFAPATIWAAWSSNVNWQDVSLVDLDNNGQADLLGRNGAVWWTAKSNGSTFVGTAAWPAFASTTAWDAFFVRDLNNDGFVDVLGKAAGEWWVAISNAGLSFTNNAAALWAGWSSAVQWKDARVGDFNGDNYADVTARHPLSGNWFVALGTGTSFGSASVWTSWSSSANWQDVRVGDFNGDGKDDLVARLNGNLHVSTAATGSFNTVAPWTNGWAAAFSYVASAKMTGTPAAPAAAPIASALADRGAATVSTTDSLALFWSSSKDDERFAAALLSGSRA